MFFTILLIILTIGGLAAIIWLVWKKLPQLRVVNPDTSRESRARRKKNEILRNRIERTGGKVARSINTRAVNPTLKSMQNIIRTVAGKLTAVERSYKEKQKIAGRSMTDPSVIQEFIDEAELYLKNEEFERAEKKLIDIIGLDQKNAHAYELLGRLYLQRRDIQLAEETFRFLTKLAKNDASAHAYLGEVLSDQGKDTEAYTYFERAMKLSPKNPKYLDFYIDSAIRQMKKHEAIVALERLRQVNPDNKKIEGFEKEIEALPSYKKHKK